MDFLPNLEGKKYSVILADPPWRFIKYSEVDQSRSPENHYDVMNLDDIKNLPVKNHAMNDCVLLLWATDPLLDKAFEVINAWGFKFKTVGFYWAKQNIKSPTFFTGMGYWTRANPEQCLLATIGHPQRKAKNVPRLVVAPRREHSRKPDEVITRIERLLDGPYLEMFARQSRPNWDTFGSEINKFDLPSDEFFTLDITV
jgi:N6-adenosine-specific RNA methylase IME4